MTARYPRGAEWRIWDLQVHTPFSELNNGFGDDLDAYARTFFLKAIAKRIAVVGVTDYFVADGYRFLSALQNDGARLATLIGPENVAAAQAITLLANVELRTDILVEGQRVNYHVIFSNEVSADDITDNFLAQLEFTCEGDPDGVDQQASLTRANLEFFGRTIKSQHASFAGKTDMFVGMMQATVSHKQVSEVLEKRKAKFGGKYIFCVPCDEDLASISWDGQGHMVRKILIQKSDLLFSSNANTRDFALGRKHTSLAEFLREFRTVKPCMHGSDAHNFDTLFEPRESRFTWIKADPTYKGLLQTLNEPDTRVFIGEVPPGLQAIRSRPTKIVKELCIHKKTNSTLSEKWFDHQLSLNPELVAIIGNKGSGKSALADVLGLVGNTPRYEAFSFLSVDRFKDRRNNKAKHFEASATWGDEKVDGPISLDDIPIEGSVETVKYIPQDYLETICNEVSLGSGSKFYEELQGVIFSHVPDAERLGFSSLDDLLRHRSEETTKSIALLMDQLRIINRELASCEDQLKETHRKSLDAQLAAKQREIEAHELTKPPEQAPPSEDLAAARSAAEVTAQLRAMEAELAEIDRQIAEVRQRLADATKRQAIAERMLGKLSNLQKQIRAGANDAEADLTELGLQWADLVKIEIEKGPVETIVRDASSEATKCRSALDLQNPLAWTVKRQQVQASIAGLGERLSAPARAYEDFKAAVRRWEEARTALVGSEDHVGTLNHLKAAIAGLPAIRERAQALEKQRIAKAQEIYAEKVSLRDDYARYYGAVQKFLSEHPIAKSAQFRLTFNVAMTEQGFAAAFLKQLNQRRVGTFAGLEEGTERLKQLLGATNFDLADGTVKFLNALMRALSEDQRQGKNNASVDLREQLAQGVNISDVYDLVFGLGYLHPVYNLRWEGKTLEQLSPGERGNLLLIFYLLIDQSDMPLVIDQPEENLDNNTVYRTLVPCVKEAKTRRQIVMVTHNPNLAVVCDAEQVICAEIRKDNGNEVQYISGSIEDPVMNRKIIDILEGTRPAFDKRDSKYLPVG